MRQKKSPKKPSSPSVSTLPQVESRYCTIPEAATYIRARVWTIRTLIWQKQIPHARIGKRIVLDKRDLDNYLQSQKQAVA